ncbi:bifunctional biotin--[acetyl-CoA-carboxylase] ligase/biotin operon repressor BirA [Colwellia sp. E2M01]|uniref:bifunctional biotin--[acetyl-CoA-carboxylase] ligase/biotin operon repressor BirA n=1 Tax=Colwellia sp. E2M01 TaxID=2841561 RepID=UPI001C0A4F87|nr:bifunctional biotin--[acetyl-CoA-carboxylase] ligase/biotin operon repressor BirA [Colwellia sp. E2M01]MBU2871021.1 bifunctional biotin--[acetyl-CoA-carboxylase] ligase/biotin operon repressor BirA [Colwellia sp. E2M01]
MTKTVKEHLIKSLAGGDFVSGQLLGEQLNISRTAIAKHIKALSDIGLDIFSVTGKGYKLAQPLQLLEKDKIISLLDPTNEKPLLEVHSIIDSTNDYLMRRLPNQVTTGQVCLAEYQSAGRGRRGRQWISPFGSQIYLSMYWYLEQGLSAAMGLSLVTALAVSDAVKAHSGVQVQLKWPNDIYLDGVKLAGILIDLDGQALEPSHCVIGIGLNLHMPEDVGKLIEQNWTDLQSHSAVKVDRNELSAQLINSLQQRLQQYQHVGLSSMLDEWHLHDAFLNQRVKLITGERITQGICRGVNNQGALLLEVNGVVKPVYGGEVSLRIDA